MSEKSQESDLRQYVRSLAELAASLRKLAAKNKNSQPAYNKLCDVLDDLNGILAKENAGELPADWIRFNK